MAAVAALLCLAAVLATVLLATAAGGSGGGYTVRAIFDYAGNITTGEDVKIYGVKVGTVGIVEATPEAKALLALKIENPGFQDFRADATCTIRPQSLLGEKYVDCVPTQPRPFGAPLPPPLAKIPEGREGAGDRFLPLQNTSSPVDIDALGDITRLPERERLRIIINELGAGLAGRGRDLNAAIRRGDPALREAVKVFDILASENKTLARLAVESDQALAPIARDRERLVGFINSSNTVARASANHRGALAENLALFPSFLRELGPAMRRLGALGEQITPVATDLGVAAPGLAKAFTNLGPFSTSATKLFESFGKSSATAGPALVSLEPLLEQLRTLGGAAKPLASNLSGLLTSVRSTGGLERIMDTIFLGAGASNGYDSLGHFLRAELVVNQCETYAVVPVSGCSAKLPKLSGSTASVARASAARAPLTRASIAASTGNDLIMERTLAVIQGATPAQAIAEFPGAAALGGGSALPAGETTASQPVGGAAGGTTYYSPAGEGSGASGLLLNYLLGN
jgi:ABC-type transporter Mla subunit MlaD